jgi:hypothetical protein
MRKIRLRANKSTAPQTTKAPLSPDHQLIIDCLSVASQLAAGHAAFKADPDGNNVYAERSADRHFVAARRTLQRVTAGTTKTIPGLLAQARLLPMLLDDDDGSVTESTETFIRSFVVNVRSCIEQTEETAKQSSA